MTPLLRTKLAIGVTYEELQSSSFSKAEYLLSLSHGIDDVYLQRLFKKSSRSAKRPLFTCYIMASSVPFDYDINFKCRLSKYTAFVCQVTGVRLRTASSCGFKLLPQFLETIPRCYGFLSRVDFPLTSTRHPPPCSPGFRNQPWSDVSSRVQRGAPTTCVTEYQWIHGSVKA